MGKASGQTQATMMAGRFAKQLATLGGPSRKLYFGQLKEALNTGAVGAKAPIIQKAVEQGLSQGSQAQTMATQEMAKIGPTSSVARSSVGQETQAALSAQAQRAVGAIPSEIINQTAQRAAPDTLAAMNSANAFLGAAQVGQSAQQQADAANKATAVGAAGAGVAAAVAIVAAAI